MTPASPRGVPGPSAEERAEHVAARERVKRRVAVRRAATRARIEVRVRLDGRILALALAGLLKDQVAVELGMTRRGVVSCCQRFGLELDVETPKYGIRADFSRSTQNSSRLAAERGQTPA